MIKNWLRWLKRWFTKKRKTPLVTGSISQPKGNTMAWHPLSHDVQQYVDTNGDPYSGAVLKAYEAGTSTPTNLATNSGGGTTVASIALNADGYPEVSGNIIIPHIDQDYKLALYPTQTAADANSGAVWTVDNLDVLTDASEMPYTPGGTGAVATDVQTKLREFVSVTDFGTTGDGVADDTAEIQAALDAHTSVYFPPGTYLVDELTITDNDVFVYGRGATLKRKDASYEPIIKATSVSNLVIADLNYDGNKSGNALDVGTHDISGGGAEITYENRGDVVLKDCDKSVVRNCVFTDSFESPIWFHDSDRCEMNNCSSFEHAREGFYIRGGSYCRVVDCYSEGGATLPWSVYGSGGTVGDTHDHNHTFEDNTGYDSQAAFMSINTKHTLVKGNTIGKKQGLASTGPGIRLGHNAATSPNLNAEYAVVEDNDISDIADAGTGGTGRGISIEEAEDSIVRKNTIINCREGIGVSVTENLALTIADNHVKDSTEIGINVYNADNTIVNGNVVNGAADAGIKLAVDDAYVKNNLVIATTRGFYINDAGTAKNNNILFEGNYATATTSWDVQTPESHEWRYNNWGLNNIYLKGASGAVPDVFASGHVSLSQTGATDVTDFDCSDGAMLVVFFEDANSTLKQSGAFRLKGGVDVNPAADTVMSFIQVNALLYEISRSF